MSTVYPPVDTPALTAAMATIDPTGEWRWLDYLSPGDIARVVWLARLIDTPVSVREGRGVAMDEIRAVAEARMAAAKEAAK